MSKLIESRWLSWLIVASVIVASVVLVWSVAEAAADEPADQRRVVAWLERQPGRWPSTSEALTVSACESGHSYTAQNRISTASGRFQFLTSTWKAQVLRMPSYLHGWAHGPARNAPPWVQDAVYVAHFKANGRWPWVCGHGASSGDRWMPEWMRPDPVVLHELRFGARGADARFLCTERDGSQTVVAVRAIRGHLRWRVAFDAARDPARADRVFWYGRRGDTPRVARAEGVRHGCLPGVVRGGDRLWRRSWSGGSAQLVR